MAYLPPPPPPPPSKGTKRLWLIIGISLLLVAAGLLGVLVWERYTTTYWFSGREQSEEFKVVPCLFFECQLRVEASHYFVAGHSASIRVTIENASGQVWFHEFGLESPGTQKETKYGSEIVTLSPGIYAIDVESRTPIPATGSPGKTEVIVERSGFFTPFGQLCWLVLFPLLGFAGLLVVSYSEKPEDLIPDLKKPFTGWRDVIFSFAGLAVIWIVFVIAMAALVGFFRSILGLLGVIVVLSIIGLVIEGIKKAGGTIKSKVSR